MIDTLNEVTLESASGEETDSGNVLEWYAKLRRICQKIHLAKGALTTRKLTERQAGAAAKLIREIENCIDNLGQSAARSSGEESAAWVPTCLRVDSQLDDLNILCEELVSTVVSTH